MKTQYIKPETNIRVQNKKQILITFDDNSILGQLVRPKLNEWVHDGLINQYETLDFIIETNTFKKISDNK